MHSNAMFLDCAAYMDDHGAARRALPAEVEYRYTVSSTDGPVEAAKIRCPRGHWLNGPIDALTWDNPQAGPSLVVTRKKQSPRISTVRLIGTVAQVSPQAADS